MAVPRFMRFYGYKLSEALNEYAKSFFMLVEAMHRLKAKEMATDITAISAGFNGSKETMLELEKNARGTRGILEQVRNIKNV